MNVFADQIAVPQFSAGAMENWGLATYREMYMLVDRRVATIYDQGSVALTLTHELLHQVQKQQYNCYFLDWKCV